MTRPPDRLTILKTLLRAATEWEAFDRVIAESPTDQHLDAVLAAPPFELSQTEIQAVLAQQLSSRRPSGIEQLRAEIAQAEGY